MARHIHVHLNGDAFNEGDHPRSPNGQFGSGGGGGSSKGKSVPSNAALAQSAHKAYVAAVSQGNSLMAAHYKKQHQKYKGLVERETQAKQAAASKARQAAQAPAKDELQSGGGKGALQHNIRTEINAGKPQKQAVAIAYSKQRESKDEQSSCGCGGLLAAKKGT